MDVGQQMAVPWAFFYRQDAKETARGRFLFCGNARKTKSAFTVEDKDHPVDACLMNGYEPPSREEREEEIYALLGEQQGIRLRAITLQWHVESVFNGKS